MARLRSRFSLDGECCDVFQKLSRLVVGKPIGILFFVGLAVLLGMAKLPKDVTWTQTLAVAFTCGIGFTMSLFIAGLAFEHGTGEYFAGDRLGMKWEPLWSSLE